MSASICLLRGKPFSGCWFLARFEGWPKSSWERKFWEESLQSGGGGDLGPLVRHLGDPGPWGETIFVQGHREKCKARRSGSVNICWSTLLFSAKASSTNHGKTLDLIWSGGVSSVVWGNSYIASWAQGLYSFCVSRTPLPLSVHAYLYTHTHTHTHTHTQSCAGPTLGVVARVAPPLIRGDRGGQNGNIQYSLFCWI